MRPVLFDSEHIRPIGIGNEKKICVKCLGESARWRVGKDPNDHFLCAYCFLYATPWGKQNAEGIAGLVASTEKAMGKTISSEGVVFPDESDRILMAIVQVSKIKMRAQMVRDGQGPGA